jgi:hypothetical protein
MLLLVDYYMPRVTPDNGGYAALAGDFIQGHQDSLRSYTHLPRAVQMNIDADFLATRYRLRGKLRSTPHIDHVPGQKISMAINGTRITSQYDACIRYHVNGYHLKQYMQHRKGWSVAVWRDIDFEEFKRHFRTLGSAQKIRQTKVVHDQLPLGPVRYRRAAIPDDILKKCPCCQTDDETWEHLMTCTSNAAQSSGIQTLYRDPKLQGAHPLRRMVVEGLRHWMKQDNTGFHPDTSVYPFHLREPFQEAVRRQSLIGWDNLLRGFVSKAWYDIADATYDIPDRRNTLDGAIRIRSLISSLYHYTEEIWIVRNARLHDQQDDTTAAIRSTSAIEIRDAYSNPDSLLFGDRHLCNQPLEKNLKSNSSTQRRWLRRIRES